MPQLDDKHIKMLNGIIVWDGVTQPETTQQGKLRWNLKVLFDPTNVDLKTFSDMANAELQTGDFKGVLPNGGRMPLGQTNPADAWAQFFPNHAVVNFNTYRQPSVFDENGAQLDAMQYGPMIYSGQVVNIICHFATYNNASKGVGAYMDGFQIVQSAQAQRLQLGSGGYDCASAFGGGAPQQQPPQNYGAPQQQPPQNYGAPQQQPPQNYGAPQQQPPQQAQGWLPNQ